MQDVPGRLRSLLAELRAHRGISQRQLADEARVNVSVVWRAETGEDCKLSTWGKLFEGMGYALEFRATELAEEAGDLLAEERERRVQRQMDGLCAGKRRFY